MKRPVEWHEQCLANQKDYLRRKREEVERLLGEIERVFNKAVFYERQISEAKRRKMNGFDSDRLLVKRSKRVTK